MEQRRKVILLAGPTASGKSKLAIKLAQHFGGEIINADSMQIKTSFIWIYLSQEKIFYWSLVKDGNPKN